MAIYVKDPETEAAVRDYAAVNGLTVTAAIKHAVATARASAEAARGQQAEQRMQAIRDIQARFAARPDHMSPEEIDAWMYDESGLPR